MIALFLADGFEECEALAPLDILRREKIKVITVGIGQKTVTGSHGIPVVADITDAQLDCSRLEGVILPGGMPGTLNLEKSETVQAALDCVAEQGGLIAAICAAPSVLGHKGLLNGKKATCFPGFEKDLKGACLSEFPVVTDGNIITAKGAGVALEFGFALLSYLKTPEESENLAKQMQFQ